MTSEHSVSQVTRRSIIDQLHSIWSGRLDQVEFLSRLYDLESMPSFDSRHETASADIAQHTAAFNDWDDDWVFTDRRFNLLHGSDEAFLRFIAETVHPIVRPDADGARDLVAMFNEHLKLDGWQLVQARELSGLPIYAPARLDDRATIVEEPTGWPKVDRQIQEARDSLRRADSEEAFQAVGLVCREVLISVAQAVYQRDQYPPLDEIEPSDTDFERMIAAVIAVELRGGANEEARGHARAALKLAVALQHKRTADFRTAALCAEATFSVVNIIAIMFGRRNN